MADLNGVEIQRVGARRRPQSVAASLVLILVAGMGLWSCRREQAQPPEEVSASDTTAVVPRYEPPTTHNFVGSAACSRCHADIAAVYETHPMAHSLTAIDASLDGGLIDADCWVSGEQRVYDVEFHDGVMRHHEKMYDAEGELIYDQAAPVQYIVGSGRGAQAFLHQRGDQLLMSPLNWYGDQGGWDMAPGHSVEDPRRFDRRITDDCLACHSGRVAAIGRGLHRYERKPFLEMSVGCENCHGPGAEHIAWHDAADGQRTGQDPIVNPANLDHSRREAVCNQCHLQAAVRLARFERSDFDFRPGQELEEIWTVLDSSTGVAEKATNRAVSHVQQMRASRCYIASEGELGCISCHDPHRLPKPEERVEFFRDRCLTCHGDGDTNVACALPAPERAAEENSCIACHMPENHTSNVAHVTQTDHRIVRLRDRDQTADETLGDPAPLDGLVFLDDSVERLNEWERDRALGLGAWLRLSKAGLPPAQGLTGFLRGVLNRGPADGELLTVLGAMALDDQQVGIATRLYERALSLPDAEEAALFGLLKIHYLSARWEEALSYADRLLVLDPGNARAHAMRADALKGLGRLDEGMDAARTALAYNPTLVPVRHWLAEACRLTGRAAEQEEQEALLRRMQTARPPSR